MTDRIDMKAVLAELKADVEWMRDPIVPKHHWYAKTILRLWDALAQEIADREADRLDKELAITALAICREQRNEEEDRANAAEARIEALEKAKGGVGRALFYLRQIAGAVDGVMADWENEKSAELVPTTIGQWAERAIIELAALAAEETP